MNDDKYDITKQEDTVAIRIQKEQDMIKEKSLAHFSQALEKDPAYTQVILLSRLRDCVRYLQKLDPCNFERINLSANTVIAQEEFITIFSQLPDFTVGAAAGGAWSDEDCDTLYDCLQGLFDTEYEDKDIQALVESEAFRQRVDVTLLLLDNPSLKQYIDVPKPAWMRDLTPSEGGYDPTAIDAEAEVHAKAAFSEAMDKDNAEYEGALKEREALTVALLNTNDVETHNLLLELDAEEITAFVLHIADTPKVLSLLEAYARPILADVDSYVASCNLPRLQEDNAKTAEDETRIAIHKKFGPIATAVSHVARVLGLHDIGGAKSPTVRAVTDVTPKEIKDYQLMQDAQKAVREAEEVTR